jgi:hypothetical protein
LGNHPQAAQFFQKHPEFAEAANQRANRWAAEHPNRAEFLHNHPEAEDRGRNSSGMSASGASTPTP